MTAGSGAGDDRAEIVARLSAVPDRLAAASRSAVGRPMPAGEWGPTEVVRHLIAVEESVWLARLTTLAAGEKPTWPWVEPAPWEGSPGASLDELLARFARLRGETLVILNGFDDEGWSRTGIHATWGEVDVATLMKKALDHDNEHIAALAAP
jgi:hypothetical protein